MSGSLKKILPGGPKEDEARKVHRKVEIAFLKKVQGGDYKRTQRPRQGTERKRQGRCLSSICFFFWPQKHQVKKRIISPENQKIGMMILHFHMLYVVLLHGMARDIRSGWHHSLWPSRTILHMLFWIMVGSRTATGRFQKHALYYGISTEACPCDKSFVYANFETGTSLESCIIHFPTTPPCSTRVDVLETGNVPILFSLHQMHKLGIALELDTKGRQNYMSSIWLVLFSGRLLHDGTYCVGFDESCVPAKVAWAVGSPDETCNTCSFAAKINLCSSHTRTGRRWRWTASCSFRR